MNYKNHYNNLIEKAKGRKNLQSYFERHHIIPKCFGGIDSRENIVKLTLREHYIAHLLLYKSQTDKRKSYQMLKTLVMMKGKSKFNFNSKNYQTLREEFCKQQSIRMSGKQHPMYGSSRSGEENPFYGKTHTTKTRKKISESRKNNIIAKDTRNGEISWVSKHDFERYDHYVGTTSGNKLTEVHKNKISEGFKRRSLLICPYCGKKGKQNMKRYHFDNCKFKENN